MKSFWSEYFSSLSQKPTLGDFLGGLTAAVVALPIALAFGVASGIGAAAGLYGAIACGIFAAAFGGTPGQVSGPTGPMTVVVAAMFALHKGQPHLVFAAIAFAGLFQMLLGRLGAGQLISYVPYPVVSGFMSGIGVIIIILQLGPFVGLASEGAVLDALQVLPNTISDAHMGALFTGIVTVATIYLLPRITRKVPAALAGLFVGSAASILFHWNAPTIGAVPQGLPLPTLPHFALHELNVVLINAMSLALLGSIDSLLTSVVVDKLRSARHNSDQELLGQGVGNLVSGLFGGLPGAGATMRSVVNVKAGGCTNWSGVFHGLILVAVLVGLGPYAARVPQACLAGILITVGISIIDYRGLKSIRKAPREDVIVMIVVILLTVFVDLIMAVVIGITLASTLFAKKLADMKSTRVDDLASLEHLLTAVDRLPHDLRQKIYVYTFDGPLFFGEMRNFTHSIEQHPEARFVILRFTNVPMIDQTAIYALEDAIARWRGAGMSVLFAELQPPIFKALEDFGLVREERYFSHLDEAIEFIAVSQAS